MAPKDPREWTPRQRTGYLAHELGELLRTVPTEQSLWAEGPEATAKRERKAERIAERMRAVEGSG